MKVTVIKIKHYQLKDILIKLDHTRQDIINNPKKSNTWKIQLTIVINFISYKDNDQERVLHSKSDNKEMMFNVKVDKVIKKLFKSFLYIYQNASEKLMKVVSLS